MRFRVVVALAGLAAACAACASVIPVSGSFDTRGRLVVAHRGAHARAAENSLGSIREARRLGVDLVELDLRTTRDGALVLLHDASVDRTTDGEGDVRDLELAQVRALALTAPDAGFAGERVPLLEEALDLVRETHEPSGEAPPAIYLHVKEADPGVLARALDRVPEGRVLVFSDDQGWLESFHRAAPARDVLPLSGWAEPAALRGDLGARSVAFDDGDFDEDSGRRLRALGVRSIVDVLGSHDVEVRALEAFALGADAVQTDEPERVLAVLGRGGA